MSSWIFAWLRKSSVNTGHRAAVRGNTFKSVYAHGVSVLYAGSKHILALLLQKAFVLGLPCPIAASAAGVPRSIGFLQEQNGVDLFECSLPRAGPVRSANRRRRREGDRNFDVNMNVRYLGLFVRAVVVDKMAADTGKWLMSVNLRSMRTGELELNSVCGR